MSSNTTLLEKYAPRDWETIVLPEKIKSSLMNIKQQKGYRVLFYGSPGNGKTSSSKILTIGDNVLYLSGSNDFNVETLRSKVTPFASGMAVKGVTKTVIIDEFENIRDNVQDAFKIILDKCKNTNFIFCTNEVEKVNTALRSRCTQFDYDFVSSNLEEHKRNYIKWLVNIVKDIVAEYKIKATKEGINLLVKNNFPDFRHTLVTLQQVIDSGSDITEEAIASCSDNTKQIVELYELIMNNGSSGEKFYQEACAYKSRERECLMALGEPFFKYLNDNSQWEKVIPAAVIVAKYCDNYNMSINKFVSFLSCISELKTLFR